MYLSGYPGGSPTDGESIESPKNGRDGFLTDGTESGRFDRESKICFEFNALDCQGKI